MSIEIKTEKIVTSAGIISRKIISFKGLSFMALPICYRTASSKPVFYVDKYNKKCVLKNFYDGSNLEYFFDEIISETNFQEIIEHCKAAGEHLKACNASLALKRSAWNGPETFII